MSTINPFVRIEDSIGRSRAGAHGRLPPPFGNEWSLLNPGSSLRADLSALLRTFCLREEAIWTMAYWAPTRPERPSAGSGESGESIAPVKSVGAEPRRATQPHENASAATSTVHATPDTPAAPQWFANRFGKRAAGLCAIGGTIILTWIGIGYLSHQQPKQDAASTQPPELVKDTPITAPPHSESSEAAAQTHAPTSSQPHLEKTTRARPGLRETSRAVRHAAHPSVTRTAKVRRRSGHMVSSAASHRLMHSSQAQRPLARPSAAGEYSPLAPATLGRDEYASIATPGGARTGHATLAPPAPLAPRSGSASDTEWMSHISQRRVTEVPDEFSK